MVTSPTVSQQLVFRAFLNRTFSWMFVGLAITAFVSWFTQSNDALLSFVFDNRIALILGELALVFVLGMFISSMSGAVAGTMFAVYAVANGLTLTPILLAYTESSVVSAFVSAATMFGVMAAIGYTTKVDLTKFGSIMLMGLVGIIIASIANMFLQSGPFGFILSIVSVVLFCGLTAYDMQKLKNIAMYGPNREGWGGESINSDVSERYAIIGALNLYLDFINLFLTLLRLFGRRR